MSRRRSIPLNDITDGDARKYMTPSTTVPTPPPESSLPRSPTSSRSPRTPPRSPRSAPHSPEWIYRRPKSPLSTPLSRSPSSSRSATPTPASIQRGWSLPQTGSQRVPTSIEKDEEDHSPTHSPFWTAILQQRGSHQSRSTPTLLSTLPSKLQRRLSNSSEKSSKFRMRSQPIQIRQRERSSSSSSSSTMSSLPHTPSPTQCSASFSHPDTRCKSPTKSILTITPRRTSSISTKNSSTNKSVTFDDMPTVRYASGREFQEAHGQGWLYGLDMNMGVNVDDMDMDSNLHIDDDGMGRRTPTPEKDKNSIKKFLTLPITRRRSEKKRPDISGPFALCPAGGVPPLPPSPRLPTLQESEVANTAHFTPIFSRTKRKSASLISPGDIPYSYSSPSLKHNASEYNSHSHPPKFRSGSLLGPGDIRVQATPPSPPLRTLPSQESFRSTRSAKSTSGRSCGGGGMGRFRHWLMRMGIGLPS